MVEVRTPEKRGTSWFAVILGWLAMAGGAALLTPVVSAQLAAPSMNLASFGAAVPPLAALVASALVGGYVAGRIAGRRTSWHGMLVAFFMLLTTLGYQLLQLAAQNGILGLPYYAFPDFFPGVLTVSQFHSQQALAFGLLMTLPAQIVPAWLGGLLAPSLSTTVTATPVRPARTISTQGGGLQPSL